MSRKNNRNLLKTRDGLTRYSVDMLIMLLALTVVACYLNGYNVLWHAAAAVVSAAVCEAVGRKLFGCPGSVKDLSSAVTGLTIALMLPAASPCWLSAMGAAFAVCIVKIPFGGTKKAPFVPAAAGWCFLSVCFSDMVFTYSPVNPGADSPLFGTEGFVSAPGLSQMLDVNRSLSLNIFGVGDILTGRLPGAMGTTCVLAMAGITAYLLLRKPKRLISTAGFVCVCAVMALLFPRVLTGRWPSLVLELSSGSLLFTALLILNDPVTAPKKPLHALIYGGVAGALCMLLRYYGKYSDCACFAVLIMNAVYPAVQEYGAMLAAALRSRLFGKGKQQPQQLPVAASSVTAPVSAVRAPKRDIRDIFFNEVAKPSDRASGNGSQEGENQDLYDRDAYDTIYEKTGRGKLGNTDDVFEELGEGALQKNINRTGAVKPSVAEKPGADKDGGDS